jgi:hypothetical protein
MTRSPADIVKTDRHQAVAQCLKKPASGSGNSYIRDNRPQSVAGNLTASNHHKPDYYFRDNRPGMIAQRRLAGNGYDQHTFQGKSARVQPAAILDDVDTPVQLVALGDKWINQQNIYQSNKVGDRISGDAEWLAIVRFCNKINIDINKTVKQNLDEAAKIKGISFDDWKGSQATNDNQEAQHLIPASLSKELKIPYAWINSPQNGKMLIAGRKVSLGAPAKYVAAKAKRGKKPNRGIIHIEKGVAHPHYNNKVEQYISKYYKDNQLTVGQPISHAHFKAITDHLRKMHKQYDTMVTASGQSNANMSVDRLDLNQLVVPNSPVSGSLTQSGKGYNPKVLGGVFGALALGTAGAISGALSGAAGGLMWGGLAGMVLGGVGGAALGALAKYKKH